MGPGCTPEPTRGRVAWERLAWAADNGVGLLPGVFHEGWSIAAGCCAGPGASGPPVRCMSRHFAPIGPAVRFVASRRGRGGGFCVGCAPFFDGDTSCELRWRGERKRGRGRGGGSLEAACAGERGTTAMHTHRTQQRACRARRATDPRLVVGVPICWMGPCARICFFLCLSLQYSSTEHMLLLARTRTPPPPPRGRNDRRPQRPPSGRTSLLLTLFANPRSYPKTSPWSNAFVSVNTV